MQNPQRHLLFIPYKRSDHILKKLTHHIEDQYEIGKESKIKAFYASMIAVLQSSGYGKSKLMEKLGSKTPTFYSSLQMGSGYPLKTFFMVKFIVALDKLIKDAVRETGAPFYMNNVSTAVYVYILRIIYVILMDRNIKNFEITENFRIDDEIENKEIFKNIIGDNFVSKKEKIFNILFSDIGKICRHAQNIKFNQSQTLELATIPIEFAQDVSASKSGQIPSIKNPNQFILCDRKIDNLENTVMELLKELKERNKVQNLPAIFVIDEAQTLRFRNLQSKSQDYNWTFQDQDINDEVHTLVNRAPYNVFRRAFRIFTNPWENLMLIIISTCGQNSVLTPEIGEDPSRRPEGADKYMETFALTPTYSANSDIAPVIGANMFKSGTYKDMDQKTEIKDWLDFLESKFRIVEYFKFGRPLIYGAFKMYEENKLRKNLYDLEMNFEDCSEFKFFGRKLFGGKDYGPTDDISLLYSMFNFAFGRNFLPSYVKKEVLVESYLMTLYKYVDNNEKGAHIVAAFLPEGVFNFLSAKYLIGNPLSLSKILFSTVECGICSPENFGELIAQSILLKTFFDIIDRDLTKVRKLIFSSIPLNIFLLSLSGMINNSVVVDFFEKNPKLIGSYVSFGYFEHFPKKNIRNPFDLMAKCLFRGSALSLNYNFPGIDLMIPLVLNDGRISFLGIQVKYVHEDSVNSTINEALKQVLFSKMFKFEECPEFKNDLPFGLLILALGKYDVEYVKVREHIEVPNDRKSPFQSPPVLVITGLPKSTRDLKVLFNFALSEYSYSGIIVDYLKETDRLYEFVEEILPDEFANSQPKS